MTFTEFLAALARTLEELAGSLPGPASPPLEPLLRVSYDPACREATAPDQILCAIRSVDSQLDARLQAQPMLDTTLQPWWSIAVLTELAAQRVRLARAQYHHYGLHSPNAEVRRFRTQLASWWGIDKSVDELQRRLAGMEEAVRTTSTLRTQDLVQIPPLRCGPGWRR
jgi:hypothetical protein